MRNKEDIGKIIKKQFKGVEVSPKDSLWDKIDTTLQKRKKKRRALMFLFFLIMLIGLSTLYFKYNYPSTTVNTPQNTDFKNEPSNKHTITETPKINNNLDIISSQSESGTINSDTVSLKNTKNSQNKKNSNNHKNSESKIITPNSKNNTQVFQKTRSKGVSSSKSQNTYNQTQEKKSESTKNIKHLNEAKQRDSVKQKTKRITLDSIKSDKNSKTNQYTKKWAISLIGGASYLNSFNKGSIIDSRLDNFNRKGTLDYSYGLAIRFELSNKIAFSYGASNTTFSYETQNIPSSDESEIDRILSYTDITSGNTITNNKLSSFLNGETETDIVHQIEYYELPFLVSYKLIDKRFGVHTLGGFSTFLLDKDNLFVKNSTGKKLQIGNSKNLVETRFSLNVGVGMYYTISDSFIIELNPTLKYNISKVSSRSSGDNPFVIGIFTALTYKIF